MHLLGSWAATAADRPAAPTSEARAAQSVLASPPPPALESLRRQNRGSGLDQSEVGRARTPRPRAPTATIAEVSDRTREAWATHAAMMRIRTD